MALRTNIIVASIAALIALGGTFALSAAPSLVPATQFVPVSTGACPRTLEQSHAVIAQLEAALEATRVRAEDNPLYQADLGYYRAELARAQTCVQNVADFNLS